MCDGIDVYGDLDDLFATRVQHVTILFVIFQSGLSEVS